MTYEFQLNLSDAIDKASRLNAKFGARYDIYMLVSDIAIKELNTMFMQLEFDTYHTSICGYPILHINVPKFYSWVSDEKVIEPVIVCRDNWHFPIDADIGDYVLWNGRLKQIFGDEEIDGDRAVTIKDVGGEIDDVPDFCQQEYVKPEFMRVKQKARAHKDWTSSVDHSAINEFFDSIPIYEKEM